jgi:hypothetical protein
MAKTKRTPREHHEHLFRILCNELPKEGNLPGWKLTKLHDLSAKLVPVEYPECPVSVWLNLDAGRGRVSARITLNREAVDLRVETPARVTFDVTRHPNHIAADLTRRLLGRFPDVLCDYATRKAEHDTYEAKVDANVAALTGTKAVTLDGFRTERAGCATLAVDRRVPDVYGTVQVYEKTCNLELRSVPVAVAVKLLRALAKAKAE